MKIHWILGFASVSLALVLSCSGDKVKVDLDALDSTSGDTVERVDTGYQLDVEPGEMVSSDAVDSGSLVPPGCCAADNDCDAGMVCVKTNQPDFGECAAVPVEPYCYFPEDCPVLHGCYDAVYCDCVEGCDPLPGLCGPANGECCEDDSDCPEGGFCMISDDDPDNTACLALPEPGKCWDDTFCDEGETCVGEKWSGCAFMFVSPLSFGSCMPLCVPDCEGRECGDDGCGGSCGDCPQGTICCGGVCPNCACEEICNDWGCCQPTESGCTEDGEWICECQTPEPEECDGIDNDCDSLTDEGFADHDMDGQANCVDEDDDGDGDPDATDCEPLDGSTYNGAEEQCDCVDNDCDGTKDEGFPDMDGDGCCDIDDDWDGDGVSDVIDNCAFAPNPLQEDFDGDFIGDACDPDDDNDYDPDDHDCNPLDGSIHHSAVEVCDFVDNNCNGKIDEGCPCEVLLEICDGYDNDCDGAVDGPPCDVDCDCPPDVPGTVCGSDGVTYASACFAECMGLAEFVPGECPGCNELCTDEEKNSGPVCSNIQTAPDACGTTFDSFCDLRCEVGSEECVSLDECPELLFPGQCKCE